MNVIAPKKPEAKISVEEIARRKAAVDYARGSVRLEGFVLPSLAEDIYSRFIAGDITRAELRTTILAHYKL